MLKLKKLVPILSLCLLFAGQAQAQQHIDKNKQGEISFPVRVLQKTGSDASRNVWLFIGDGYTKKQQEKFFQDAKQRVEKILLIEPYKSYKDALNIYAIAAVSKESGVSRAADKGKNNAIIKDTYLGVHHNSVGLERLGWFFPEGEKHLQQLIKQMEKHYLDKGGKVMQTSVLSNSDMYFGGGALNYAVASLAAGEAMVLHEASHGFANLADEYNGNPQEGPNKTKQTKLKKVPWREFFGFRNVQLYKYGNGAQKPVSGDCLMNSLYAQHGYCEVCKEHVAAILNKGLKKEARPYYMAEPSLTFYEPEIMKTGAEVTRSKLLLAQQRKLQLRTVVHNFTDAEQLYFLRLTVRDDKLHTKYQKEVAVHVPAGKLKSLALVTEPLPDISDSDVVSWMLCLGETRQLIRQGGI